MTIRIFFQESLSQLLLCEGFNVISDMLDDSSCSINTIVCKFESISLKSSEQFHKPRKSLRKSASKMTGLTVSVSMPREHVKKL